MEPSPNASPDIPRLLTLYARQVLQHGFEAPGASRIAEWARGPGLRLMFFGGDPRRVPETWDVAIVLPDILAAYLPELHVALLDPSLSQALAAQYEVTILPTLVFLRDGHILGAIERMRDWDEYASRIATIVMRADTSSPAAPPAFKAH